MALLGTACPPRDLTAAGWITRPVPLRFRVGEITLLRRTLRLYEYVRPFATLAEHDGAWAPPPDALPDDVDGTLVRSQPVAAPLPRITRQDGWLRYVPQQYERCTIDLTGTFDDYVARFSSKTRSTLRRKVRKLDDAADGTLQLRVFRTPEQLRAFHGQARVVSARTYQERLLDAGIPDTIGFIQEMTALAEQEQVRGFLLLFQEQPIAYLYCPLRDGVALYQYVGHDPAHAAFSPGTVLLYLALEQLFADDAATTFDFTDGTGPHKAFFATHQRQCADIYHLRDVPRLRRLVRLHAWADDIGTSAGRLLKRLGLKRLVRKLLRGQS